MKLYLSALSAASLMVMLTGCGGVQKAVESAIIDGTSKVATAAAD